MANRLAKAVHHLFQCGKDLVSETLCAKFAPNLLNRIHFGRIGRNMQNGHIFRHFQLAGLMPRCAVTNDNQNIVRKFIVQSIQKKLHTFCVTIWNHQKETFTRHRLNHTITYQYSRIWWHGTLGRCPLLHQQRFALLIRPNPASSWNIKRILFVGFWIAKSLTVSLIF